MCDYDDMAMTGNNIQLATMVDTGSEYGTMAHDVRVTDA